MKDHNNNNGEGSFIDKHMEKEHNGVESRSQLLFFEGNNQSKFDWNYFDSLQIRWRSNYMYVIHKINRFLKTLIFEKKKILDRVNPSVDYPKGLADERWDLLGEGGPDPLGWFQKQISFII